MVLVNISARDAVTSRIVVLIEQIDNVIQLDDRRLLETQLTRVKSLLLDIGNQFQYQRREHLETLNNCLERMENKVRSARLLIQRSQWPQQCFHSLFSRPKVSGQISDWKTNVNEISKELQMDLVETGIKHGEVSGQISDSKTNVNELFEELPMGLVHTGIRHGEVVVERWLREAPHVRIIGVCGCAGIGKTRLLQNVYNTHKVSDVFDVVIWVTVGQSGIPEMQDCIARAINLDLSFQHYNNEIGKHMRKIKLFEYLKTKKFLLIFDDLYSGVDLNELGMEFGADNGSKFICSSRYSSVIEVMGAKNYIYIEPLTSEEAWELFSSVAFEDGYLPQDLGHIARNVADECKGLPLAINVIAATMRGNTSVNQWNLALRQMRAPIDRPSPGAIDGRLYQILRCCYERLPDANFKSCFLCCAMFPRDEEIEVDKMVGMWIAEGLVKSMDTAYSYVKLLVDRCFFQVTHIPHGIVFLKTDRTLRAMAVYIGKVEEDYLFDAKLRNYLFRDIEMNEWKRISFYGDNIKSLPANGSLPAKGFKCEKLVSLKLAANKDLEEIPMSFLAYPYLPSIRVLDLSRTKIKLLPRTLWQLKLAYLDISYTQIEDLSEDIGYLLDLQFLNMCGCSKLESLPKAIGHLHELQFLNITRCSKLISIPSVIYDLKKLKYFQYNTFLI